MMWKEAMHIELETSNIQLQGNYVLFLWQVLVKNDQNFPAYSLLGRLIG